MSELIERLAQKLVAAREVDCAYGDCAEFANLVPHGEEITYDTITGHEGSADSWTRVEIVPTDEQWAVAVARAEVLWSEQSV